MPLPLRGMPPFTRARKSDSTAVAVLERLPWDEVRACGVSRNYAVPSLARCGIAECAPQTMVVGEAA